MAAKQNFTIEQGATFKSRLIWKTQTGQVIKLIGWSAKMQIRKTVDDPTVVLELSTVNGRIALGGTTGTVDLTIADEDSALMTPGTYVFDLLLEDPTGAKTRLIEGRITVAAGVTRG